MSPTSSTHSAPPAYSTNPPPNLDLPQQQHLHSQQQQGEVQQPQQQQGVFQQPQQLLPQYGVQQYPSFLQGYIAQPQLFYYPYPYPYPQQFPLPVPAPVHPYPGPAFYTAPYPSPPIFFHPHAQLPPQAQYVQQPRAVQPFQPPTFQSPASPNPTSEQPYSNENMQIVPTSQTGFVPHPPAIIPGIPGVHRYPLIVSKEGEGPPPEPIFIDGYGYQRYEGQVRETQ